jgi:hypothetical protein
LLDEGWWAMGGHVQLFTLRPRPEVHWRLLSGNNREVGRGAEMYADVEAAIVAIKQFQLRVVELVPQVGRASPNHWRWTLSLAATTVVASGHPFDRQIRCKQALAQFLSLFSSAPIGDGLMASGSRRGRP